MIQQPRFLQPSEKEQTNEAILVNNQNPTKIVSAVKKLLSDIENLKSTANDNTNLKLSYKAYVEDANAKQNAISSRLDAIELQLKTLIERLNGIENLA